MSNVYSKEEEGLAVFGQLSDVCNDFGGVFFERTKLLIYRIVS